MASESRVWPPPRKGYLMLGGGGGAWPFIGLRNVTGAEKRESEFDGHHGVENGFFQTRYGLFQPSGRGMKPRIND